MMSDKFGLSNVVIRLAAIVAMFLLSTNQSFSSGIPGLKVGIILQANGEIFPPAKQFSQLISQKSFDLADDAFLELAIYADCRIVQINGPGILTVTDELLWSGGRLEEKSSGDCVKPLVYSNPNLQKAGINLRGRLGQAKQSSLQEDETLLISSKPTIIFDGFREIESNKLVIVGNDGQFSVELESVVTDWPNDVTGLVAGKNYQFFFMKNKRQSDEVYDAKIKLNDAESSNSNGYLIIRFQ